MKHYVTSSGKNIYVYDDLFTYTERDNFYLFISNSLYTPKGGDTLYPENANEKNLYSAFDVSDVEQMGLFYSNGWEKIKDHFLNMNLEGIRVNLSTLSDKNRIHVDGIGNTKTLIYYPNMRWDIEWGGHTLFTNEDATEIEFAVAYKPGRVVIFDGVIPHGIGAPTVVAPTFRYSFVLQYKG